MTWPYPTLPNGYQLTQLVRTVTGQDDFGNDVYSSTPVTVMPISVQPGSTRESTGRFTDQVVSSLQLFLPYGTPVSPQDAFIWEGNTYEVTGAPEEHMSPFTGHTGPLRVTVTLIEGASP